MKYFIRKVLVREAINHFGKLGYRRHTFSLKTNSEKVLAEANKGKRWKFYETSDKNLIKAIRHQKADVVVDRGVFDD